jgi:hypothetical protein
VDANARHLRCHGEAIYPGVIDPATGESIIKGKTITGFTTQAEYDMHIMDPIRSWGEPLIDEWAAKLGAKCKFLEAPSNAVLRRSCFFTLANTFGT